VVDDRVTVRIGPTTAEFERGMLVALALTLGEWYEVAGRALAAWPVERVTVRDVSGLVCYVEPPTEDRPDWRLTAGMTVYPARPVPPSSRGLWARLVDLLVNPGTPVGYVPQPLRWSFGWPYPDRAALVGDAAKRSARLVDEVRVAAAGYWVGG
jgi:hypothetical protein